MGSQLPQQKEAQQPPLFGPCLLWPNGNMDQDATCSTQVRIPALAQFTLCYMGTQLLTKGHSPLIFGPCRSVLAKQLDRSRCQLVRSLTVVSLVVLDGTALPSLFDPCQLRGQTAGWTRIPLATEVGSAKARCVRCGFSSLEERAQHPHTHTHFSAQARSPISAIAEDLLYSSD